MKLLDILDRDGIVPDLASPDKEGILHELAERVAKVAGGRISVADLERKLLERERERSTGIGSGVAVPHARTAEVDKLVVVFGRSRKGVDFQALDREPCHLFFALVSPEEQAGVHLAALARICKLLKNDRLRDQLMAADDAGALYDALKAEDARV